MNHESQVLQVNLDDIIPNRFQPRIAFDEQGLKELSDSIKEHGIIQPLVLRKLGNKFEIIAGERRYKAATMAGLTTVPAVISNLDDNKSAEVALVENIQRRDLTPIEEAKSYKSLLDKGYLTQEQLAKRMGISQPAIANKLRLLNLDDEVQQALLGEKISERHARALLQLTDKEQQRQWLNRIINERLTVRQLDQEIKKYLNEESSETSIPTVSLNPSIEEIKAAAQDIGTINNIVEDNKIQSSNINESIFNPISMPKEENKLMNENNVSNDNKFFNFTDIQSEELKSSNVFSNTDLEIIDMPALIDKKEDTMVKEESTINQPEVLTTSFEPTANNKFFTGFGENAPANNDILAPQPEVVIDPMTHVSFLDSSIGEEIKAIRNDDLLDAINEVRKSIDNLKSKGFSINSEELDLEKQYQIIIKIDE